MKNRAYLLLLIIVSLSACQQKSEISSKEPDASLKSEKLVQKSVRYDFVEYFPVADIQQPIHRIVFSDQEASLHLTEGWYESENTPSGIGRCWIKGGVGRIKVPLVQKSPIKIRMKVAPIRKLKFATEYLRFKELPSQHLKVLWNGTELENVLLDKYQELEVDIPADQQMLGTNQLVLAPGVWVKPNLVNSDSNDPRDIGVFSSGIEFESEISSLTPLPDVARLEQDTLVQYPDSVISYHFHLPKHPTIRLKGIVKVQSDSSLQSDQGRVSLAIRSQDGSEQIIFDQDVKTLKDQGEFTLKEKLSDLAGKMVGIHFCVSGRVPGNDRPFYIEWREAAIDGVEEVPAAPEEIPKGKYNLLLVCFDALRADFTGPYGNTEVKTPGMDRLSKRGTVFENCYATAPYTVSSVASYLTSVYESVHKNTGHGSRIPEDLPNLQETLAGAGYRTALFSCNTFVSDSFGFKRGFSDYRELFQEQKYMADDQRIEKLWQEQVEPYLKERDTDKEPFFLYVHAIDPHSPYIPPSPYREMYDNDYRGNVRGDLETLDLIDTHLMEVTPRDIQHIASLYKGEITNADRFLEWLQDYLSQSGLAENTMVVFISDHGEEFYENRRMEHSRTLYHESLHVPMIWSLPTAIPQSARTETPVQLIDIAPTFLNLVGVEVPHTMQGRDLSASFESVEQGVRPRPILSSRSLVFHSVLYGNLKFISSRQPEKMKVELYDMTKDPDEEIDLWADRPIIAKTLEQMIDWQLHRDESIEVTKVEVVPIEEMNPKLLEQLQALGYMD